MLPKCDNDKLTLLYGSKYSNACIENIDMTNIMSFNGKKKDITFLVPDDCDILWTISMKKLKHKAKYPFATLLKLLILISNCKYCVGWLQRCFLPFNYSKKIYKK